MVVGLFFPCLAFAQDDAPKTLFAQNKQIVEQIGLIPKLIAIGCYVIGVFYTIKALIGLKNYIANPEENPINTFISFGAIGAFLIMLPYSLVFMMQTFAMGVPTVNSSASTFVDNAGVGRERATNIGDTFANLAFEFVPLAKVMAVFSYVFAAMITLTGLLHLKQYGDDPSQMPLKSILIKFILASCLISLPFAMQIFVTSVTGRDSIEDQAVVNRPCVVMGSGLAKLRGTVQTGNACL
jgi:hypothetical protein